MNTDTARRGDVDRRGEFLAAAGALFAQQGFTESSMTEIGQRVGVSGPAFYRHFPNKEAILVELLLGCSYRLLSVAEDRVARTAAGESVLRQLIEWHVAFAMSDQDLITIQYRDLSHLPESDRAHIRWLQRAYLTVWVDAIRAEVPGVTEVHARAATQCVFGLINSTPHSSRMDADAMTTLLERMAWEVLTGAKGLPALVFNRSYQALTNAEE